jgi:ribosomal protein S18 acetylase RimI-like enzyme
MPAMIPSIRYLDEFRTEDVFALFTDVYASGLMSADLGDQYACLDDFREKMQEVTARPGAIALAAEVDGKPAGYVTVIPRTAARLRHTADLNMGIASEHRGKGLGKALLDEALRRAAGGGVLEIVYLMVRADNLPAVRLYESAGFERLAVLERDIKAGADYFDGVLMRRFIP